MEMAMLDCLKTPDAALNSIIRTHFRCKKAHILQQCNEWAAAAAVADKTAKEHHHMGLHDLTNKTAAQMRAMVGSVEAALSELTVEQVTLD
jgi:hypothetical protein